VFEDAVPAASTAGNPETVLRATPAVATPADNVARWPLLLDLLASPDFLIPDPTAFLNRFLRHLAGSVSVDFGQVYGRDEVQQRWRLLAHFGPPEATVTDTEAFRSWQALADLVFQQEDRVLFSNDVLYDPRCVDPVFQTAPFRSVAAVMLQFDRKALGALLIGGASPGAFATHDSAFLLSAANLLIAPLLRHEQGRNRRRWPSDTTSSWVNGPNPRHKSSTDPVVEWLRGFVARPDPATLSAACDDFLKQIVVRTGADGGVVSRWDDLSQREESMAVIESSSSDDALDPPIHPNVLEPAIPDSVVSEPPPSTPPVIAATDPPPVMEKNSDVNAPYLLQVPIPSEKGTDWGNLTLQRRKIPFPSDAQDIAGLAAKVLGKTIAGISHVERANRHFEEAAAIDRMARILVQHRVPEPMLTEAADALVQALDLTACSFFCFDVRRIFLQGLAASGTYGNAVRKITVPIRADHLVALTARNKEPTIVNHARADERIDKRWANLFQSRAILFLPLLAYDQVIGVVALDDNRTSHKWTPEQIDHAIRLTGPIALALDNAIHHQAAMAEREAMKSHARSIADAHEAERRRMARRFREAIEKGICPMKTWLAQQKTATPPQLPPLTAETPIAPVLGEQDAPRPLVADKASPDATAQAVFSPRTPPSEMRAPDWASMRRQIDHMEEVFRGIANFLHAPQLERSGILAALQSESDAFAKRSGVAVHFKPTAATPPRLPQPMETLLYRIVQETFNNVARHAGADTVILSLEKKGPNVHLTVSDDGKGFDARRRPATGNGIGLIWIRERVGLSGGRFSVDSAVGRGTRVSVVLPMTGRPTETSRTKGQERPGQRG